MYGSINCYKGWTLFPGRMGKIKRGNYIFLSWIGDHGHHVHVYKDDRLVVKWDVDNWLPMEGKATRRIEDLLKELLAEGKL